MYHARRYIPAALFQVFMMSFELNFNDNIIKFKILESQKTQSHKDVLAAHNKRVSWQN